jgi:LPS-assembly lipoprotein
MMHTFLRTIGLVVLSLSLLSGCGFKLRGQQKMAFETLAITPDRGGEVATALRRYWGDAVLPLQSNIDTPAAQKPQVVLDILQELREKNVVGVNSSGQVREFQLRLRVRFRLRTPQGLELISPTEIVQQRDISFNESAVLSKEAEEQLLYRDMQNDIVQQVLRRLSAVTSLAPPEAVAPSLVRP